MNRSKSPGQLSLFSTGEGVTRCPLRYFGGKWLIAPWIYQKFPKHFRYVELFGGGFSVGVRKPASKSEIYNEKNERIFNFFVQVKYRPQAVLEAAKAHAQINLKLWWEKSPNAIEDAAQTFLVGAHGRNGAGGRWAGGIGDRPPAPFDMLHPLSQRLRGVDLYNSDYQDLLDRSDLLGPATLVYADPPYLHTERASKDSRHKQGAPRRQYAHELGVEGHGQLLERLKSLNCMVVISGYWSNLYDISLAGWEWCRRKSPNTSLGPSEKYYEYLWFNPQAMAQLGLRGWPCVA